MNWLGRCAVKGALLPGFVGLAFLICSWLIALPARGQAPPGPLEPKPGVKPEPPRPIQPGTIRVRVNEVTAPVTVLNAEGELVLNLEKKDFHVFDNGIERPIDQWDLGGDHLSIVLVAETSSHIEPLMPAIHKASIVFTQTVMTLSGSAAVIGYDDDITLLQPFTSDQDTIEKTIRDLKVGYSGMRLYDAMSRAVSLLDKQPTNRRRVMLILGEAQDSGARTSWARCCARRSWRT